MRLIWAQARGGVIGYQGAMPWHLPEDLKHFRETTLGRPVIMGRRTWDSIQPKYRPLPGRENIVITRQQDWHPDGATVAHSLPEALDQATAKAWVIGGAQVFAEALPYATVAVVTEIDADFPGDAYAPALDGAWQLESAAPAEGWLESRTGLRYRIRTHRRS
jgi:dihydrofolate reductase